MSYAEITISEQENPDCGDTPMPCVFATCCVSGDEVGPIWGSSDDSIRRALATLTEECSCGTNWHEAE